MAARARHMMAAFALLHTVPALGTLLDPQTQDQLRLLQQFIRLHLGLVLLTRLPQMIGGDLAI